MDTPTGGQAAERWDLTLTTELDLSAPPAAAWEWLSNAADWPKWAPTCRRLRFGSGWGPRLAPGAEFVALTFGLRMRTRVVDYVEGREFELDGRGVGVRGLMRWTLQPVGNCCHATLRLRLRGLGPRWTRSLLKPLIRAQYQRWLEELRKRARAGAPPCEPAAAPP